MTAMHSVWRADVRHEGTEPSEQDQTGQGALGNVGERSTSAPPLPSDSGQITSVPFSIKSSSRSPNDNLWFGNSTEDEVPSTSVPPFATLLKTQSDQGPGRFAHRKKSNRSYFDGNDGRATAPGTYNPSSLSEALNSPGLGRLSHSASSHSFCGESRFDFDSNGDDGCSLIRSKSAAPELAHVRNTIPPPPGLTQRQGRGNESFLFECANDPDTVVKTGPRRPASTGVIGQQNSSALSSVMSSLGLMPEDMGAGAVRPAPKTLMDLIQEDFPKSPSPVYGGAEYSGRRSGPLNPTRLDHDVSSDGCGGGQFQYSPRHPQSPALLAEPQPPYQPLFGRKDFRRDDVHLDEAGLGHVAGRLQFSPRQPQSLSTSKTPEFSPAPASEPSPSLGAQSQCAETLRPTRGVHVPVLNAGDRDTNRQDAQFTHHRASQHEQITMIYNNGVGGGRPASGSSIPTQILQTGPAVYLSQPAYGYATVQYHPGSAHHQHPHVMHHPHQTVTGSLPPHEFISLVPVQGGAPPHIPAVPSNRTYTYWHQQDIASGVTGAAPAVAIVTAPSGSASVTRRGSTVIASPGRSRHGRAAVTSTLGARSPSEKGRSRRGGGQNHRRATGNTDGTFSSAVLDEFRAAKSREWTVTDIKGHIVEFCQDQNGSRLIQQRLEIGDPTEQLIVMDEVLPAVRLLRNDVFGNYVVQKLLERGTPKMKASLRDSLGGEMLPLSLQMYGCRVVQKALETLDEDDLPDLLMEFRHNVLSCIHDQNGNHVIQKCIEVMSSRARKAQSMGDGARAQFLTKQIDFVVEDVLRNVAALSCHPYGCRVLQRILEHCDGNKKSRALDEISRCHSILLDDQYGNYVIQHVLQYGRHSDRESVLGIVLESGLLTMSKQKFASNVVEKLLQYGTAEQRNVIAREMLKVVDEENIIREEGKAGSSSVVLIMVRDAYANYVVQTALDVLVDGEEKKLLLEELRSHSSQLRNYAFAKHIATKLSN